VPLLALALAGCGGSGVSGDAVARVGGNEITKAQFGHWMSVAESSTSVATGSKPVIPEPPNYTACIAHLAHLAATAPKPAKGQTAPTTAQLETQCATQYKSLQTEVLGFLISSSWVLGEASSLGVRVSTQEVDTQLAKLERAQYPKAGEFAKYLANSGQTASDVFYRERLNLLSHGLEAAISKQPRDVTEAQVVKYYDENQARFRAPGGRGRPGRRQPLAAVRSQIEQTLITAQTQTALVGFVKEFRKRWQAKTECGAEYMVPDCKGYRTPKPSSLTSSAKAGL